VTGKTAKRKKSKTKEQAKPEWNTEKLEKRLAAEGLEKDRSKELINNFSEASESSRAAADTWARTGKLGTTPEFDGLTPQVLSKYFSDIAVLHIIVGAEAAIARVKKRKRGARKDTADVQ